MRVFAPVSRSLRPGWCPRADYLPALGRFGLDGLPRLALHRLQLDTWTLPDLRIAVIADPHVCRPWVTPERLAEIVALVNAQQPDLTLIAGDILPDRNLPCRHLPADVIVPVLDALTAPLGVHAVMGNHDWKDCRRSLDTDFRENSVVDAYATSRVRLGRNAAVPLSHRGAVVWLVMTDSQKIRRADDTALYDADAAFAPVPRGAPAIHLAHEPDCFGDGEDRAMLQISGHTHGGQFTLFGRRPMVPSRFGDRYAQGHFVENGRHLIVSAGLGYSGLPLRFGVPPDITLIDLRPDTQGDTLP